MSTGAWAMLVVTVLALGVLVLLMFTTIKSILNERSGDRSVWREFGLGLSLMVLFFVTWGTLPGSAPTSDGEGWKLPETPRGRRQLQRSGLATTSRRCPKLSCTNLRRSVTSPVVPA